MMDFCVCIVAYNRPLFFAQTLNALIPQIHDIPTYFFIDGPEATNSYTGMVADETRLLIDAQVSLFARLVPAGTIVANETNFGIARQWRKARQYVLERHERALFLEDDIVVAPYYVSMIQRLMDSLESDPRIGMVSGFGDTYDSVAAQVARKTLLKPMIHMLGWATWRDRYEQIATHLADYYRLIEGIPYPKRDHAKIRSWYQSNGVSKPNTGQDFATAYACHKAGLVRVTTRPNHLRHIGAFGVNSAFGQWEKNQLKWSQKPMVNAPTEMWEWNEGTYRACVELQERFFGGCCS